MAVQTQIQVRRGTASSWTSTNPTLAAGEIGFESDTGKIKVGTGSATWNSLTYIGAANAIQYVYNATAGQTTFSGADANGLTLSYTVGAEQVYVNGVLQVRTSDYTATNGTSVVLASGALVGDVITVIAYGTFTVADTYTQAQANATFPLNTSSFFAGKNKIINGDFGVWQRGTSGFSLGGGYNADRWAFYRDGSGATDAITQQTFTPGTAPVAGYEGTYYWQYQATVAGTGGTERSLYQRIEDVRTFAGQTITLSFWAKADTARTLTSYIGQNFGSGGSASVNTSTTNHSVTTSWARYTATYTLASISGKTIGTSSFLQVVIGSPVNVASTIQIWGVQLEAGSIATAFQTATGTIQGELAACQRYYYRVGGDVAYQSISGTFAKSTTQGEANIYMPVTMRVAPTSVEYSTLGFYDGTTITAINSGSINAGQTGKQVANIVLGVASGLTQYRPYQVFTNNSTSGYLALSAEL